jgi:hypothetical protein
MAVRFLLETKVCENVTKILFIAGMRTTTS